VTAVLFLIAAALAVGGYLYARYRFRVWKVERQTRRTLTGHANAKAKDERTRPVSQRLHAALPDRIVTAIVRHRPQRIRGKRIRIAVRGLFLGRIRSIRIDPEQHIACIGRTGSGKSSVLRVMGAWALAHPGWDVYAMDGKYGASVTGYRGHATVLDTMDAIEAKLRHIVGHDFPVRGHAVRRRHTALIIDESRVFNDLSAQGMADLVAVMQMGRELGFHVWAGMQDFKVSSVPSEIRSQFSCRLGHQVMTEEDSRLIFKDQASAGWEPHKLTAPGQMLVWEPGRKPRVSFGLWLAPAALASTAFPVHLTKAPKPSGVAVAGIVTRSSTRENTGATATATPPADGLKDAVERALLGGPMGVQAVARATGYNPGTISRKLARMTEQGITQRTDKGAYALATAPKEQDR